MEFITIKSLYHSPPALYHSPHLSHRPSIKFFLITNLRYKNIVLLTFINTFHKQKIKPCHPTNYNMNADDVNISLSKLAISMVEAVVSNPAPAPPKSKKRKNHRGGRKTKKKQNSSTGQNTLTAPKDVAVISTVKAIIPILAKKQKQTNRKRCSTEITVAAPDTVTERQNDSTRPCHHSADSSTLELSPSRGVDENTSARVETCEAISAAEQGSLSGGEGASGDIAIHSKDGLETRFKGVTTMAETSQGE